MLDCVLFLWTNYFSPISKKKVYGITNSNGKFMHGFLFKRRADFCVLTKKYATTKPHFLETQQKSIWQPDNFMLFSNQLFRIHVASDGHTHQLLRQTLTVLSGSHPGLEQIQLVGNKFPTFRGFVRNTENL